MSAIKIREVVEAGKDYLLSRITNGLCLEFHQLRHGPSWAWTTACVGSTLAEFEVNPEKMLETILSLQSDQGGWSYNPNSIPDADSTLRALQYLHKIGFQDDLVTSKAERFVLLHQQEDGGFATYLPENLSSMGYPAASGWSVSHSCVTALATNVIHDSSALEKAWQYLEKHLVCSDARAYWWKTPLYILYETGRLQEVALSQDPVEISLALLLKAKREISDQGLIKELAHLQYEDGSFPPSRVFRIPRPHQFLDGITGEEEVVEDKQGIFSTCAAIVLPLHDKKPFLTKPWPGRPNTTQCVCPPGLFF